MNPELQNELAAPAIATLDGHEFPLAYPLSAVVHYKRLTGPLNEDGVGDNLFNGATWNRIAPGEDPERFQFCLLAGIHGGGHPEITLEQLGQWVDFSNALELTQAMTTALVSYFPAASNPPKAEPKKRKNPSGLPSSGPSPDSISA